LKKSLERKENPKYLSGNMAKELAKAGINLNYMNLTPEEKEVAWR